MGGLHLLQGGLMVYLLLMIDRFNAFRLPMQSNFLTFDAAAMRLVTVTKLVWNAPFALCVSVFLFLSAIAHFIIAAPGTNESDHMPAIGERYKAFFPHDAANPLA